jgi:Conserved oligomeric complex COG6
MRVAFCGEGVRCSRNGVQYVDRVSGANCCGCMQVRIEQVLASGPQLLVCFRLSQLLGFYAETVVQLAGPDNALVASLQAAQVLSFGCLFCLLYQ